jgi:hypothetical protein
MLLTRRPEMYFSNSMPSLDRQLPDGSMIGTAPTGHTYTTKRVEALRKLNDDHVADLRVVRHPDSAEHIFRRYIEGE